MDATLLERDGSTAALDQLMSSAREGAGRVAIIGGEAGVGKTSLVERFVAHNRSSASVLWGACGAPAMPCPPHAP